jgi:hypothetical protein
MKSKYLKYIFSLYLIFSVAACADSNAQVPEKTVITGTVTDAKTGEPLYGTNVVMEKSTIGTITDSKGKYRIETAKPSANIVFSFIGYDSQTHKVMRGKSQTIDVKLNLSSIAIEGVVIKPARRSYKNKNNPAVELIDKVIENKDNNRKERFDFLQFRQYEKVQFAFSNVSDKFEQNGLFRKYHFIFDNIDTTKRIGNKILPFFIREDMSDLYYRKDPEAKKEITLASKTINLNEYIDNKGVSANLDYLYQNINIYDNEILFLTNKFLSPIAKSAPAFYRYYIIDTLLVSDKKCIRLFFEPRNKSDFLFHGYLYITQDTSYAIRKIDIGINKNTNIDWVQNISATQDFENHGEFGWLLSREEIAIDFGIVKNTLGLYGQRTLSYNDYRINEPIDPKVFSGPEKVDNTDPTSDNSKYLTQNRPIPLTRTESGIYTTVDSLNKVPAFKRQMNILMLITTNFLNLGKIELGPDESFYSFNSVEGSRVRFGGRTTPKFSKKINFDGYLAYGIKDNKFKYNAGLTYSFTPRTIYQFPVKSLRLSYMSDTKIPGQEFQFSEADNIFMSLKRGVDDKFFFNNTFSAEFLNEFQNHFSYTLGYSYTAQSPYGNLYFNTENYLAAYNSTNHLNISELSLGLRYAKNETFYQGKLYRYPFASRHLTTQFKIAGGSDLIGNDYNYLRLQTNISRRFYFSVVGYADISLEAGRIFGKVPYPLLFIHRANQTYSYQKDSYNLMNFLEFVSDKYAALNIDYSFNGFIFNKIPLLKKLKLREVVTLKALYGGLDKSNNPDYQSDLLKFPLDADGVPLTNTLEKKPYIEASIGVSNLFRIFRVDLIRRFTYINLPNVSTTGIRIQFRFDI